MSVARPGLLSSPGETHSPSTQGRVSSGASTGNAMFVSPPLTTVRHEDSDMDFFGRPRSQGTPMSERNAHSSSGLSHNEHLRVFHNYNDVSGSSPQAQRPNTSSFTPTRTTSVPNRPHSQGAESPRLPPLIPISPRGTKDTLRVTIDTTYTEPQINYQFSPTGKLLESPHRTRLPSKGILRASSAGMFTPNRSKPQSAQSHPVHPLSPGSDAFAAHPTQHQQQQHQQQQRLRPNSGSRPGSGAPDGPTFHHHGPRMGSAGSTGSGSATGSGFGSGMGRYPGHSPHHGAYTPGTAPGTASSRGVEPLQLPATPGNLFTLSPSSQYPMSIITPLDTGVTNHSDSFSVQSQSTAPSAVPSGEPSVASTTPGTGDHNERLGSDGGPQLRTEGHKEDGEDQDGLPPDMEWIEGDFSDLYSNPYGIPPGTSLEDLYDKDFSTHAHQYAHGNALDEAPYHGPDYSAYGHSHAHHHHHRKPAVNGLWNVPMPTMHSMPTAVNAANAYPSVTGAATRNSGPMGRGGHTSHMRSSHRATINTDPIKPTEVLSEYEERKAKRDKMDYEMQMGLHMIDKKRKDKVFLDLTRNLDKHLLRDKPHLARADLEVLRYKQNAALQARIRFEQLVERRRQGRERVVGSKAELERLQQVHFTERENVRRSIMRDVVKTEIDFLETMKRMGIRTVAGLADAFA